MSSSSNRTPNSPSSSPGSQRSSARHRARGSVFALARLLQLKGGLGPAEWTIGNRKRLMDALELKPNVNSALTLAGITRNQLNPLVKQFLNGEIGVHALFAKTPAKSTKKPGTQKKKVKFENGGNGNATGNTRNNPIIVNAIKKLENKLAKQEEAIVRARESQTQQALENSRRELAQIRREIREQQRNLREVVMRRGSVNGSYRPGGLRATPYYTRFMERVYQRGDGQFVTLSPNGRPRRPMAYPNFTYRDTGRGIVLHAPMYPRRPQRKTLFRL